MTLPHAAWQATLMTPAQASNTALWPGCLLLSWPAARHVAVPDGLSPSKPQYLMVQWR